MAPHTGVQNSKAHEPFNDTAASNGQVVEMALNVAKFSRIPEGVTKSGMRMYIRPSKSWILNLGSLQLSRKYMMVNQNCNSLGNSVFYTHTHHSGGREGRREHGQPATNNNRKTVGNTTKAENRQGSTHQAGRAKEKERGGRGGESTRNPTLAGRRAKAQSRTGNKAKPPSSETTEAWQQREGTNTLLGEGGERGLGGWEGGKKRKERKRREKKGGGVPSAAYCAHGPTRGRGRCTQLYSCIQGHTREGGKGERNETSTWCWEYYFALWLLKRTLPIGP